jgi:hypothetical protein
MSDDLLFPEVFVGWRSWRVVNNRLVSLTHDEVWPVGDQLRANAKLCGGRHKAPNAKCRECGIYAKKSLNGLIRSGYFDHDAFGMVSLWGRVVDSTDGYRAEFAYPKTIYVTYMNLRLIEPLSVYGVPVKAVNPYKRKDGPRRGRR